MREASATQYSHRSSVTSAQLISPASSHVRRARNAGLTITLAKCLLANVLASALACSSPSGRSAMSVWPVWRPFLLHSVAPWRSSQTSLLWSIYPDIITVWTSYARNHSALYFKLGHMLHSSSIKACISILACALPAATSALSCHTCGALLCGTTLEDSPFFTGKFDKERPLRDLLLPTTTTGSSYRHAFGECICTLVHLK